MIFVTGKTVVLSNGDDNNTSIIKVALWYAGVAVC